MNPERHRSWTIAILLTVAATGTSAFGYIDLFTVTPLEPTCDDEVTLAVWGSYPDLCFSVSGHELTAVENELWLVVHVFDGWQPGMNCSDAIYEYAASETVGPLPPGYYTAIAWEDVTSLRVPEGDLVWTPFLACCEQPAAPVTDLRLEKIQDGHGLRFTWTDVAWSDEYHLYQDFSSQGSFPIPVGSTTTGVTGIDAPMPSASAFFLLATENECGEGPKH